MALPFACSVVNPEEVTMKTNVMMLAVAAMLTSVAASAVDKKTALLESGELKAVRPAASQAPGVSGNSLYKVMPQLKAVEDGAPVVGRVVSRLGGRALVESVAPSRVTNPEITPGAVVQNTMTGELGYYSGNLLVMLKDPAKSAEVQKSFNLSVVRVGGVESLVLYRAAAGTDLRKLRTELLASGLVREARLDLVEKRNQPQ
jgi:hypothetical protein